MTVTDDERLGPAFDNNILSRPTQRKFVGCWMDRAVLDTLILPQVWRELTATPSGMAPTSSVQAWLRMEETPETPFRWAILDAEQAKTAAEIRRLFTQVCFPRSVPDEITTNSDAIILRLGEAPRRACGREHATRIGTAAEQVGVQPELGKGRGAGTDDVPPIQVVALRADARRVAPGASAAEGVARAANHMGRSASPVSYR